MYTSGQILFRNIWNYSIMKEFYNDGMWETDEIREEDYA